MNNNFNDLRKALIVRLSDYAEQWLDSDSRDVDAHSDTIECAIDDIIEEIAEWEKEQGIEDGLAVAGELS